MTVIQFPERKVKQQIFQKALWIAGQNDYPHSDYFSNTIWLALEMGDLEYASDMLKKFEIAVQLYRSKILKD